MRSTYVLVLALGLVGCTEKSGDARCEELSDYLEGRETNVPRECAVHEDCTVVFVRPDRPFAGTYQPEDDELSRAILSYRQNCGPLPHAEGELWAECVERFVEVVGPDGTGSVEESVGRSCVLRGDYTVPDAPEDVGDVGDAGGDVDACGCRSASDCASGELCHACECVPATLCGEACIAADRCGSLIDLGLGTSAVACAAGCESAVETAPDTFGAFAECLRSQSCDQLPGCARVVP